MKRKEGVSRQFVYLHLCIKLEDSEYLTKSHKQESEHPYKSCKTGCH